MKLIKVMGPWSWELTPSGQQAARRLAAKPPSSDVEPVRQRLRSLPSSLAIPFHERVLIEAARIQGNELDVIPNRPESDLRVMAEGASGESSTDWHTSRDRELLLAALSEGERRGWMRLLKVMGPWGWTVTATGLEKAHQLTAAPAIRAPEPTSSQLPSGVLTFLLTDIEGSTRMWEADRVAMQKAVMAHNDRVERIVSAAGGTVVKSRGEGDSTFSVFWQPTDAIDAALTMQLDFQQRTWPKGVALRIRAAIHAGQVAPVGDD
jgi:hypothetical protein